MLPYGRETFFLFFGSKRIEQEEPHKLFYLNFLCGWVYVTMLNFGNFLFFPEKYKNRTPSTKNLSFQNFQFHYNPTTQSVWFFAVINGKYDVDISLKLAGQDFSMSTPCKVNCTCESFTYEFMHALYLNDGLLKPESYHPNMLKKPSKKNTFNIPSGCKHIVFFANQLWQNRAFYRTAIKEYAKKVARGDA